MSGSDNAQPPSQETPADAPLLPPQIEDVAQPRRKPRELKDPKQPKEPQKKSRVIVIAVNPTECVDDQKPPSPPPEIPVETPPPPAIPTETPPPDVVAPKPKAKSRATAEAKITSYLYSFE